jgi:hypothetical protein
MASTATAPQPPPQVEHTAGHPGWRLFGLSFLMLFTELAMIRWTGSNNIHLAYLTNFVLLASFLGIGIGFLRARAEPSGFPWMPVFLVALVGFVLLFPVRIHALSDPHPIGRWGWAPLPQWLSLSVTFVLAALVMATIAQAVARSFMTFKPLEAYRLDILGSIAGIAVFSALSFLHLPPVAWGVLVGAVFIALVWPRARWWQLAALLLVVGGLTLESIAPHDQWSPYYKVTAENLPSHRGLKIWANNIPHQTAYPVAELHKIQRFYFFPYRHVTAKPPGDVLIVGAGSGNDVAVALRQGARHVDAVEIDPVIQALGRDRHPNHPYSDPRVSVHINDGRAYLEQNSKKYDLILFALPDSLTLLPGQSNLRLENYLFTTEAMRSARAHLKPHGSFSMYNYYEPFLLDRYAGTLKSVYGTRPCVELGASLVARRQAVLSVGNAPVAKCAHPWQGKKVDPVTDDRPYPYLTSRAIPPFYVHTLALVLLASLIAVRLLGGPFRSMGRYVDLMFMGGAFLLLETKNIVQFALLFGTTWVVNSLVFAGILLSVFAAVEVARRVRLPRPMVLFAALFVALGVAWVVPPDDLLSLSTVPRFLVAIAIAFTPIFLANLIFAQRFKDVGSSTTAFGANLLGAMIGGVLEYLALITGYRFLLVVVAGLYLLAFVSGRRLATAQS